MKKKVFLIPMALLLAASLIVLFSSGKPAPKEKAPKEKVWRMACLYPFSGPAAGWGVESRYVMETAMEDINAAGGIKVGGETYKMEMVWYDNKWDPATTLTVARKAIFDDRIKYISTYSASEIDAINTLCQREEVLLYGHTGGGDWFGPKYPFTWYVLYYTPDNLPVLLEYVTKTYPGLRRVAGIYTDSPTGVTIKELSEKIFPEWGFEFIGAEYVPGEQEDFYPLLTRLLAKNPDMLDLGGMPPAQRGAIVKQAYELGFGGKRGDEIFFCSETFNFKECASIAGWDALEGAIGREFIEMTTELGKNWLKRFQAKGGGEAGPWPYYYDGVWLLKLAIEKANTFDTWEVCQALETVEFDGIFGKTSFGGMETFKINRVLNIQIPVAEVINGVPKDVYSALPVRSRPK